MKKFTNFNFGGPRMDREWTEVEPRMDRSTLATMCRYIAMIFAVLVMSIGQAWGEPCKRLPAGRTVPRERIKAS